MRIRLHFRIHGHVQDVVRKVRRSAVLVFVLLILFGGVVAGKNIFLSRLETEVRKSFRYGDLRLSYFPPAIVVEDVGSLPGPALFEARRVRIEIPFLSLLRNEKAVNVLIVEPRLRLRAGALRGGGGKPQALPVSLPFTILRGLIEGGTVTFEGEGGVFEVRGLKATLAQHGDGFSLKAASDKTTFTVRPKNLELSGSLNVALTGKGDEVRVDRLTFEGGDLALKAEGRLKGLEDPEVDLDTRFEAEMARVAVLLNLPFTWKGKAGGQGKLARREGVLSFGSDVNADGLVLGGVPMGRVHGRLEFGSDRGGRVDLDIQKPGRPVESVAIALRAGRLDGEVKGAFLDPVMNDIGIPWPVKSLAWGTFSVDKGKLQARAEFRDQTLDREGDRFAFRGDVDVRYDPATRDVTISTQDLQAAFGRLEARNSLRINGTIDTEIRGTVTDLKQAREFVALAIRQPLDFPEIRGAGFTDVRLTGRTANPKVSIRGSFQPAGFDLFNAAFTEGEATVLGAEFTGQFRVDDPGLKGEVRVAAGPARTEVAVEKAEGDLAKVFAALRIPVALAGRAAGDFEVVETAKSEDVHGTFLSP
ncbi:MAG TPA: hypothetical protein VEG35_00030, partial [Burkholderiales bacterium]|nr:hypothetical protein [Burkholderiales bacterium]